MALLLNEEHAHETEDSDPKIVKFTVVKKREEDHARQVKSTSFEEAMLPHLDAAHNLARWLLRNEQDAQDVVCVRSSRSQDSTAAMAAPGC